MLWRPGVIAADDIERDAARHQAKVLRGVGTSLTAAAQDHVLLNPFIFPLMLPAAELDLLTECMRQTGMPRERLCLLLPEAVFDYREAGKRLGIPGNLLLAIPKPEWPVVQQFLRSVTLLDPASREHYFVRLSCLRVRDPSVSASRPIAAAEDDTVMVWSVALELQRTAAVLVATQQWPRNPQYVTEIIRTGGDARGVAVCEHFLTGETNPITKAENEYGWFDFGIDDDHPGRIQGGDGQGP